VSNRRVIVIDQGSDSSGSVSFEGVQVGDVAYGQIRRWAGHPKVLARMDCTVDVVKNEVDWEVESGQSSLLTRNGLYYDIKVVRGARIITVAFGPVVVRPGITVPDPYTWAEFSALDYGSYATLDWGLVA
jgi:hypothetical protein